MITLKKKARFFDFDYGKPFAKHPVDSWAIRPGKAGTGDDEPGIGLLIETDLENIELRILRSELYVLIADVAAKYPEACDCGGCSASPPADCSDECCWDIYCSCGDCKGCVL